MRNSCREGLSGGGKVVMDGMYMTMLSSVDSK